MRRIVPVMLLSACLDTTLPGAPPPPGAGIVQGNLVWVEPGQGSVRPATGATVELVSTGVRTTASGETAFFSLTPVDSSSSPLLIRFDADGDGRQERQRVIDLAPLKAGRGKTISLGQVTVGNTAFVRGVIRRADVSGRSGHAGTAIVIPETPYFTYTGDDGSFLFDNLPEGPLRLASFREGYGSVSVRLEPTGGTVTELSPRTIEPLTGPRVAKVQGRVLLPEGTPASDVTVRHSGGASTRTDGSGAYTFNDVPYGVYSVAFSKDGYLTAQQVKLVIAAPLVELRDVTLAPGTSLMPMLEGPLPAYDGGEAFDAGLDAGFDAGFDAGVDAGVDAGLDAGVDAGFDAGVDAGFDAGVDAGLDAGMDAGVDAGADAGFDAGIDAGQLPIARIVAPAFVLPSTPFTLSALSSSGAQPLEYVWSTTPAITFPNLLPSGLGMPTVTSPSMAGIVRIQLQVRDVNGVLSLPTSVLMPVGRPPLAVISPSTVPPTIGGQRVILSGAGSSAPDMTGVSQYEWTVSDPSIVATPLDGGIGLQLDMPPSVPTAILVNVGLNVVSGIGIRSASPASRSFNLGTGSAPMWSVSAGSLQTKGVGEAATLAGSVVVPPGSVPNFVYRWSPDREPDSGVADFVLTDAGALVTTFVTPRVDGPVHRQITFTLTVTDTSNTLTPSSLSATTYVIVADNRPPRFVASSIVGPNGPLTWAWVEYDEPIAVAPNIMVTGAGSYFLIGVSGRRAYIVLSPPLTPGVATTLTSSVNDLASPSNMSVPFSQVFVPAAPWTPAFESTSSSIGEPWPGIVVRRTVDFRVEAFVFARRDTSSWFFTSFDPYGCATPPCSLIDDPSAPAMTLSGPRPLGHKGWLLNGRPVATLQVADFQGTPGVSFEFRDAGWASLPAAPQAIFGSGRSLSSVAFEPGGVARLMVLDGGWTPSTSIPSLVTTNLVEYPQDTAPFAYGNALVVAGPAVILKSSRSATHTGFVFNSSLVPNNWSPATPLGPALDARVTSLSPQNGNAGVSILLNLDGGLDTRYFSGCCTAQPANNHVTSVSSFDALSAHNAYYVAVVSSGQLELRAASSASATTWIRIPGPLRAGMPGFSLNNDTACQADRPELALTEAQIVVTWQERCAGGPWRVYVRALE